jgi:hypothetical protein
MIEERLVNINLKNALVNNAPIKYAHLIKFERPSKPDSITGLVSTSKERYTYLTDASIDVSFDDGSTSLSGVANGTQVYLANKILDVGSVQEQTKATASQTTVVVDGNALGARLTSSVIISVVSTGVWDIAFQAPVTLDDVLEEGFREGDKVAFLISGTSYPVNITAFRSSNTLRVSKIDVDLPTGTVTAILSLSSEEVISILLNKNDTNYASFINREVFIYRAYFDADTNQILGTPINLFKGIIQNVSFEDTEQAIKVSWGLTSHWGDFSQVRGRVTSDDSHRALDENGVPQPFSTLKPIYAYDKGFMHAETSLNLLARYSVTYQDIDNIKSKKGFLGIGAKTRINYKTVTEDRFTDLDFQLSAKSIPVIYGVRVTEGIGVFADTLNTDSSTVYAISAISEGEIGGIYDIYVDGQSLICVDEADFDARSDEVVRTSDASEAIEIFCRGRSDRGDVLGGSSGLRYDLPTINMFAAGLEFDSLFVRENYISEGRYVQYEVPAELAPAKQYTPGTGIIDGQSVTLSSPLQFTLDFFSGKPGQKAASQLVDIAKNKQFKVQNDYWTGSDTTEYWGPNHRLLDTAYVVGKFKIAEGDTSLPELKMVVRGKIIDCYNYDGSYLKDRKTTGESAANFPLGSTVSIFSQAGTLLNSNVQIIDKWTFFNPDGTSNTRFRFSVTPTLGYVNGVPTITKFYMQNGASQRWTMVTYNHKEFTGNIANNISAGTLATTTVGSNLGFTFASNTDMTVEGDPTHNSPIFRIVDANLDNLTDSSLLSQSAFSGTVTATALTTLYPASVYTGQVVPAGALLASTNTIRLPTAASSLNDTYVGDTIEVVRFNSGTGRSFVQTAEIIAYQGSTRIATIDTLWTFIPKSGDTVTIFPRYTDKRVSTNPAIQTTDYLTSKTYGRGLDIGKDVNLPSVISTAQKCDTRSDVSVGTSTTGAIVGDVYRYPSAGNILWQGKVTLSKTGKFATRVVTFTDVIGKLTNLWNSWKNWDAGTILHYDGRIYTVDAYTAPATGIKTAEPTHTSGSVNGLTYVSTTLALTRVSGTGPTSLAIPTTAGNPVFDERDGRKISGYSIYDSDDINYWKLCGWDGHDQRYVTKYQTNLQIDTSVPLFDNTNGLLEHYNGILRYTSGQYFLNIEEPVAVTQGSSSTDTIRIVTTDDIIGKIQLSDEGVRSAFNSVTAAFADPANKFEARNVSFFNSEYLRIDRNVPKKGNLSVPGSTNYYNTRILADGLLNKSRFGLTISFTMRYHGILLLAGSIIQVVYPRYGSSWDAPGKRFRIESLTYQADGLVDVVAKEYDDSFYGASNLSGGSSSANITAGSSPVTSVPGNPTDLVVTSADSTDELINGVELFWNNHPSVIDSANVFTEVYGGMAQKLFVTVSDIAGDTLTTSTAHGLSQGMAVYPQKTVDSPNTFTAPLDMFAWSGTAANAATLSRDTTTSLSPVGGIPLKMAVTGTDPHTGTSNSATWNVAAAANGQTWTFSVYVKASVATTGQLFIFGANSAGSYSAINNFGAGSVNITTEWTRVSHSFTFSNANVAFIQVRMDGPETGGAGINIWWDGAQLEQASAPSVFNPNRANLLDDTKVYFVYEVPTSTTFKLSLERPSNVGSTPVIFARGTGLSLPVRTATLLASLAVPTRSYMDTIANEVSGRVEKYYWVRHKVIRT